MKIYYKTTLEGELSTVGLGLSDRPPSEFVHEYKLIEIVDICCEEMKVALDEEAILFGDFYGDSLNRDNNLNFAHCSPYPEGAVYREYPIKYCPFCGQVVETEEKLRVTLKVKLKKRVVTERETVEIPVTKHSSENVGRMKDE